MICVVLIGLVPVCTNTFSLQSDAFFRCALVCCLMTIFYTSIQTHLSLHIDELFMKMAASQQLLLLNNNFAHLPRPI